MRASIYYDDSGRNFHSDRRCGTILLCAFAVCFISLVGSGNARETEVLPERLCFVIRDDGDILQKVRIRGDFSAYSTFEILYKPEAIQVVGLDRPDASGVLNLELILQFPEGTYAETEALWEQLTEERIRRLQMRGKRVSKRHLPSMAMYSKLQILVVGSTLEEVTITIPLKAVFDFSGTKRSAVSSGYAE